MTRGLYEFVEDPRDRRESDPERERAAGDDTDTDEIEERLREVVTYARTSDERVAERRAAVRAAYQHLRTQGEATTSDLRTVAARAVDLDTAGYQDDRQLWSNCVRESIQQLPGVEGPGERSNTYHYSE